MSTRQSTDIVIIGAGPSGSVAAGLLRKAGREVVIIERETFPRFSIGESLLPQSMEYIEKAGFLQDVVQAGFQYKNGAAFARGADRTAFDFREKFSPGWGTTYQVQRAHFDHVLANGAAKAGADIRYRHTVLAADVGGARPVLTVRGEDDRVYEIEANFLLDASGFGRTLPRLLDLETPSDFPVRGAIFTHIEDGIPAGVFDRNKILITVHPEHHDVWYWLIPFSNGRCSIGVVAERDFLSQYQGDDTGRLKAIVFEDAGLAELLKQARWDTPARTLTGYAANVKSLHGNRFALLGNAGEFLDPVFSSGVTIAVKSADLAVNALLREAAGETVDWEQAYAKPLKKGVDTFRAFVTAWYDGRFQKIIFHKDKNPQIEAMISSILAGYAWDEANPYVAKPERRLSSLEAACALFD
ncbi:NAD(P)/FAD-dependent oxidoreductase [Jeongeupia chitinilytica]|uniref:FAD-dependent oxidoreductase n=1 Tax=Jeongeupia chitinilytica TaxID=1041641 RepID=A0ABQ3H5Z1_9NEIS|nr:NAD(P)/FAD-dependent oxidoreductase [Jeongeupia chitinilytica]GHD69031.1 FAD-dependent oxidoreductase [Jeongeupia chitinilytica]